MTKFLTGAAVQASGIALPVTTTEFGKNTINLLCLALEIELGTKTPKATTVNKVHRPETPRT